MKILLAVLFALLLVLPIIVGISAFFAWLIWLAWTYVAVAAFGAPSLTFIQCWIAMIAINILLAGLRSATSTKK